MGQRQQCGGGRLVGEQGDGRHTLFPWAGPPRGKDISVCHPSWGPHLGGRDNPRVLLGTGMQAAGPARPAWAGPCTQGCSCAARGSNWAREGAIVWARVRRCHGLRHSPLPQDPSQQAATVYNLPHTLAIQPLPCLLPSLPPRWPHHSILQLQIPALPPTHTIIWDRLALTPPPRPGK